MPRPYTCNMPRPCICNIAEMDEIARPNRRSVRLRDYDYRQAGGYFVTICAYQRECLFGNVANGEMLLNELGGIVRECWSELPNHFGNVQLDEFIVMPNHFHGILFITDVGARHASPVQAHNERIGPQAGSLGAIVGSFKSAVTKRVNTLRNTPGAPAWQRNYHEHVIRNDISLAEIREYIGNNPLQWEMDELNPLRATHASPLRGF